VIHPPSNPQGRRPNPNSRFDDEKQRLTGGPKEVAQGFPYSIGVGSRRFRAPKVFTKANLQHGTTPFFADRLKEVPRSIKAFSKTPACITYPLRRPLPDLPWVSAFPELNLRLYVEYEGKPGVWFLSLDAANWLAVWAARRFFHLPYFHARMSLEQKSERVTYRSIRLDEPNGLEFNATYQPTSNVYESTPGSLEHWLTERYCLYSMSSRGQLYRAEIHHQPWPLQSAEAEIAKNELLVPHELNVSGPPTQLHFAKQIDVVVWTPEPID
jgi:uncharacterized protein YqjF (DUF2071 family)